MSYILDALRKAERDRQVARVPTLATAHAGAGSARQLPWAWAVAGGLALSAVVGYGAFRAAGRPDAGRETAPPAAVVSPATSGGSDAAGRPSPPLERAPGRAEAPPGPTADPSVERPPGGRTHAPSRVSSLTPAAKAPRAASPPEDRRRAPTASRPPAEAETRRAAVAEPRPPSAVPRGDPGAEPRAAGDPAAPPAAALAPGPPPGPEANREPSRLTLDVLVYSDAPAERLVFINGRKYVEGQAVDGDVVLEQITPDGAILRHQGRRLVLRPRLNPYARPGSP